MPLNQWSELLDDAVETMEEEEEIGDDRIPQASAREWIAEWARENRRCQRELLLTTAHRAQGPKGLEFDHVVILDGHWGHAGQRGTETALLCRHDPGAPHPHPD